MLDALLETIGTLAVLASIAAKFTYFRATNGATNSAATDAAPRRASRPACRSAIKRAH